MHNNGCTFKEPAKYQLNLGVGETIVVYILIYTSLWPTDIVVALKLQRLQVLIALTGIEPVLEFT